MNVHSFIIPPKALTPPPRRRPMISSFILSTPFPVEPSTLSHHISVRSFPCHQFTIRTHFSEARNNNKSFSLALLPLSLGRLEKRRGKEDNDEKEKRRSKVLCLCTQLNICENCLLFDGRHTVCSQRDKGGIRLFFSSSGPLYVILESKRSTKMENIDD